MFHFQGEAMLNTCLRLFGKDYKYSVSSKEDWFAYTL